MFFMSRRLRQEERDREMRQNDAAVEAIKESVRVRVNAPTENMELITKLAKKYGTSGVLFVAMGGKERDD